MDDEERGEFYKIAFWMLIGVVAFAGAVAFGLIVARLFGL